MDPAPHPYRDGLPPAPPGPPEGEQHRRPAAASLGWGLVLGPVLPLVLPGLAAGPVLGAVAALAAALGLGRWLHALGAAERHAAERRREESEILQYPERERWEVAAVLHRYGLRGDALARAVEQVSAEPRRWVDFMMRFELDLLEPDPRRGATEGLALAAATAAAGAGCVLAGALGGAGVAAALGLGLALAGGAFAGQAAGESPPAAAARAAALLGAAVGAAFIARTLG